MHAHAHARTHAAYFANVASLFISLLLSLSHTHTSPPPTLDAATHPQDAYREDLTRLTTSLGVEKERAQSAHSSLAAESASYQAGGCTRPNAVDP
jgi:hypothetical protein